MKVVIVGGPKVGKTTFAGKLMVTLGLEIDAVKHTDDLIDMGDWNTIPDLVMGWMEEPGPWVIEGVQTARALRRWLKQRIDPPPVDRIIVLDTPFVQLTSRQEGMRKGVMKIFAEVEPLLPKGVVVLRP